MEQAGEILKKTTAAIQKENTPTYSNTETPHGAGESRAAVCPRCGGLGYLRHDLPVDHPDFGKLFPCTCRLEEMQVRRARELRKLSNVEALTRFTFDRFVPQGHGLNPEKRRNLQRAYEMAREFAAQPKGWLTLIGGYGCGKTHLAAAIANQRIALNQAVLFVNVPDLLDHLRATYNPSSEVSYDERFETVRTAPVLVLDDLGTENTTAWASEKLYQILNYRYNAQLPTVITTNHRLEEIDVRLRSRMQDQDLCQIYTILARDFRGGGGPIDQSELSSLNLHRDQTFASFYDRTDLEPKDRSKLHEALLAAQTYAEDPKDWLLFVGGHGSGKTHLAAAIANYRFDRGYSVLFITVPDLLDHLRSTFSPTSLVSYDKRFEELRTAPLLILDDLGVQSTTPWAREKLYQLLDYRYNARLPTIVTSALSLEELEKQAPELSSRLVDRTRCTHFALAVQAFRGEGGPIRRHNRRKR